MSSHYSAAFNPDFTLIADNAARQIVGRFNGVNRKLYPVLCYTGFSGISTGTMLAHFLREHIRVEQFYVRKENEQSHGSYIEFSSSDIGPNGVPVFVDDFIGSGDTIKWVKEQVYNFYTQKGMCDKTYPWGIHKEWRMFPMLENDNTFAMPYILIHGSGEIAINFNTKYCKQFIA